MSSAMGEGAPLGVKLQFSGADSPTEMSSSVSENESGSKSETKRSVSCPSLLLLF